MVVADDPLAEFLNEASSHLDAADRELARLAVDGRDAILGILRRIHTIRGTAGFLALPHLEQLRVVETVLDDLRNRTVLPLDAERRVRGALAIARAIVTGASKPHAPARPSMEPAGETGPVECAAGLVLPVPAATIDRLCEIAEALASPTGDAPGPRRVLAERLGREVAAARRQNLRVAWSKLGRVVDEIAAGTGKSILFQTSGGEVTLDYTAVRLVRDALTHLVRNAAHHGIETAADRVERGKPAFGTIRLSAFTRPTEVVVELTDDGAGLDLEAIRSRAVALGLATPETAIGLEAGVLSGLVFTPGFSTSDKVGALSGLGIGLDVVRTNIAQLGGTVTLDVPDGGGLSVIIAVPLGASAASEPRRAEPDRRGGAILLAAAPGPARDGVRALLTALGDDVETADDADDALARVLARPFQAIVAEQDLPIRPGLDLARAVRRHPPLAGIGFVLVLAPGATVPDEERRALGVSTIPDPFGRRPLRGPSEIRTAA